MPTTSFDRADREAAGRGDLGEERGDPLAVGLAPDLEEAAADEVVVPEAERALGRRRRVSKRPSASTIMMTSEAFRISEAKRASTRSDGPALAQRASSRRITPWRAMTRSVSTKIATVMS